jgi:thiamine pyrophosphokinase
VDNIFPHNVLRRGELIGSVLLGLRNVMMLNCLEKGVVVCSTVVILPRTPVGDLDSVVCAGFELVHGDI